MGLLTEDFQIVGGLSPSADLYNGDPATDVVGMAGYNKVHFLLHQNTGGTNTGTATVTVEAVDNAAGSNAVAIPFRYRAKTTGASSAWGAVTAATASGFTTTANEDTIYEIQVEDQDLPDTQSYVRMVLTEAVDDPVLGSVMILLVGSRYKEPNQIDSLA